ELLEAVAYALQQALGGAVLACDAHDRHVERAALHHRLERWEDLLVREVTGSAEQNQRVTGLRSHVVGPLARLVCSATAMLAHGFDASTIGSTCTPPARSISDCLTSPSSTGAGRRARSARAPRRSGGCRRSG